MTVAGRFSPPMIEAIMAMVASRSMPTVRFRRDFAAL